LKLVDIPEKKKKQYLKGKIDELQTNSKTKTMRDLYRDINDFKKGYQPRTNIVKDDKGDIVTDCLSVLVFVGTITLRYSMYMELVMLGREKYTQQNHLPDLSALKVEMAIEKLRSHISPGIDQTPAELFKAGGKTIYSEIYKLINSV
jgi:hypothetical protein